MQTTVVIIVAIYMLGMLWIGFWSSKMISSSTDFMVAGRRMGPILMAGTLAATEIGGGSSLGVVEKASNLGAAKWGLSASWYILAMGVAFIILMFFAPKFRASEVKTVPEYFRKRYGKAAGLFTAITMILPLIGLTAGQFMASATILSVMLGIGWQLSLIIVALIVTTYAVMGGMWSVAITDFVQVALIILGMFIAIPFSLKYGGGWDNIINNVPPEAFNLFSGIGGWKAIVALIIMYVSTFTVGQEAVSRYYSARDGKAAVRGSLLAAIINGVYAFIPAVLGIITLAIVNMNLVPSDTILSRGARYALPVLATLTMPSVIVGLLFSGIISATMSSADSDMLGAGSIFGNDIYKQYIKPQASDEEVIKVTRITMIFVGAFSLIVAIMATSIIDLLMFSFTLRAAGAFFPYVFGHYWKRASHAGAIASLIIGGIVSVLFERKWIPGLTFFGWEEQPVIPGLVCALIVFLIFSFVMPNKKESVALTD
ncbi:MAG TPA: sodium:solute symporter family protein [Acetomicrobium flavidum]|uniref:sodium:solute symporter family protein n=2 Tax=Acetomicrobium flavidum TaxID=49896 RepID=UPI002C495EBE|nr:sodium:solute symporter family protein [Acetomicrobium flavidum]HOM31368.1 sodium:solute symporter family protein [Acetomicrobium flavidum]